MAAIPSAINIIENHLSSSAEFGKFQQQSIYQLIKPSTIIENDKEQLIDVELEEGGPAAAKKDIRHQYTKIWPFFVLKTANWVCGYFTRQLIDWEFTLLSASSSPLGYWH
jgi:hypothetical protein